MPLSDKFKESLLAVQERNAKKRDAKWAQSVPGRENQSTELTPPTIRYRTKEEQEKLFGLRYDNSKVKSDFRSFIQGSRMSADDYTKMVDLEYEKMLRATTRVLKQQYWASNTGASNGFVVVDEIVPVEPEDFGCMWCGEGFTTEGERDEHEHHCAE